MLDEMEVWDEAVLPTAEAGVSEAAVVVDFFAPSASGVGLIRPSVASSWQPAAQQLQSQPSAGVFAQSAGLPVPEAPPQPELDASLRVVAVGSAGFQPALVMLTEGQPDQFVPEQPGQVAEVALSAPELDLSWDDDAENGEAMTAEGDEGSEQVAAAAEEFVAVETGSNLDLGEIALDASETQAVEMPPFEEGDDVGIDIDL